MSFFRFISFLLRLAHDKASQKEIAVEELMKVQIEELKSQIDIGKNAEEPKETSSEAAQALSAARFVKAYKMEERW